MSGSNVACAILFIVSALVQCAHSLNYHDLEALGLDCANFEKRYSCSVDSEKRGCECDEICNRYNDCCINAPRRRTSSARRATRNRFTCMDVGEILDEGVFVIATCPTYLPRTSEMHEKCEGAVDLSDPLIAAPVIAENNITYANRYCAECNDVNMATLKTFHLKLSCPGIEFMTDEQVYADLKYNSQLSAWGIDRWNSSSNETDFGTCDIIFDVPSYLNNTVRYCKPNLISKCPPGNTRSIVQKNCEDYMAVVYEGERSYRNPHCAICNNKRVGVLGCGATIDGRRKNMSFALLLDVNMNDGDQVGQTRVATPVCALNQKYDPFFKKCRKLVCALPNHVVVNDKCVRQT